MSTFVGFAVFDATANVGRVYVGWAEFDAQNDNGITPVISQGGIGGYGSRQRWSHFSSQYDDDKRQYNVRTTDIDESEEEEILMQILMEVAKNEL